MQLGSTIFQVAKISLIKNASRTIAQFDIPLALTLEYGSEQNDIQRDVECNHADGSSNTRTNERLLPGQIITLQAIISMLFTCAIKLFCCVITWQSQVQSKQAVARLWVQSSYTQHHCFLVLVLLINNGIHMYVSGLPN